MQQVPRMSSVKCALGIEILEEEEEIGARV